MNAEQPLEYMKMSVEDYLKLDEQSEERYEYIDGYAYMLAGGSSDHSAIIMQFGAELIASLRGKPCSVRGSDMKVYISETRFVYPDISVSCDKRDRHQLKIRYPILVVEVLSPGTRGYDRGKKGEYYRRLPTLQEYVLVETDQPLIQVYRRANSNMWTLHTYGPDEQVELTSIGATLSLDAIYENVFDEDEGGVE